MCISSLHTTKKSHINQSPNWLLSLSKNTYNWNCISFLGKKYNFKTHRVFMCFFSLLSSHLSVCKRNIKIRFWDELRESKVANETKAMEWKPVLFFVNFISFFIRKKKIQIYQSCHTAKRATVQKYIDRVNRKFKNYHESDRLYCAHTHSHNQISIDNLLGIILILCLKLKQFILFSSSLLIFSCWLRCWCFCLARYISSRVCFFSLRCLICVVSSFSSKMLEFSYN